MASSRVSRASRASSTNSSRVRAARADLEKNKTEESYKRGAEELRAQTERRRAEQQLDKERRRVELELETQQLETQRERLLREGERAGLAAEIRILTEEDGDQGGQTIDPGQQQQANEDRNTSLMDTPNERQQPWPTNVTGGGPVVINGQFPRVNLTPVDKRMQNQITKRRDLESFGMDGGLLRHVEGNNERLVNSGPIDSGQQLHVDTGGTMGGYGEVATRSGGQAEAEHRLPTTVNRNPNVGRPTMPVSAEWQRVMPEQRMSYAAAVVGNNGRQNAFVNNQGRTA